MAHGTWPDIDLDEIRDWVKTDKFRSQVDIEKAESGVDLDEFYLAA